MIFEQRLMSETPVLSQIKYVLFRLICLQVLFYSSSTFAEDLSSKAKINVSENESLCLDKHPDIQLAYLSEYPFLSPEVQYWIEKNSLIQKKIENRYITEVILFVVICFVFFIVWNISLKKEIEKRKQAEARLFVAKQTAEKANQAKSSFISSMSHELRTPLNAIIGFSQLIEIDTDDSGVLESSHEIIHAGKHLLVLINQILELSKIESGVITLDMAQHNLSDILTECLSLTKSLAREKSVKIRMLVEPQLNVYVDKIRFKQVMLNLISNAIKYNVYAGKVLIEVTERQDNMLRLNVIDTGKGLRDEQKVHLFKSFYRAGAEGSDIEGTGLGLAISKELIEQMNGAIGFESELGKGSCFWVELRTEKNICS